MTDRVTRSRRTTAGQGGVLERLQRDSHRITTNPEPPGNSLIPEGTEVNPLAPPPAASRKRKKDQVCFLLLVKTFPDTKYSQDDFQPLPESPIRRPAAPAMHLAGPDERYGLPPEYVMQRISRSAGDLEVFLTPL